MQDDLHPFKESVNRRPQSQNKINMPSQITRKILANQVAARVPKKEKENIISDVQEPKRPTFASNKFNSPQVSPIRRMNLEAMSERKSVLNSDKFVNKKEKMVKFENIDLEIEEQLKKMHLKDIKYPELDFKINLGECELRNLPNTAEAEKDQSELKCLAYKNQVPAFNTASTGIYTDTGLYKIEIEPNKIQIKEHLQRVQPLNPPEGVEGLPRAFPNSTSIEDLNQLATHSAYNTQGTRGSYRFEQSVLISTSEQMIENNFIAKAAVLHLLQFVVAFGVSFVPQFVPTIQTFLNTYWWIFLICLGGSLVIYVLLFSISKIRTVKPLVVTFYCLFTLFNAGASLFLSCLTTNQTKVQIVIGFLLVLTFLQFFKFAGKNRLFSFYSGFVFLVSVVLGITGYSIIFFGPTYYSVILGSALGTGGYGLILTFDYAQMERCTRNFYFSDEWTLAAILLPIDFFMIIFHWAKGLSDNFHHADVGSRLSFRNSIRETFRNSYRNFNRTSVNNFN